MQFLGKNPIAPAILNLHATIICANQHFKLKIEFLQNHIC